MTTFQRLTYRLQGITAGDYLAYVRIPEPPGLGTRLRSITVDAEPLGDSIEAVLAWDGPAPAPAEAEILAGLPVTADVASVTRRSLSAALAA
jgi:hypothetical protein